MARPRRRRPVAVDPGRADLVLAAVSAGGLRDFVDRAVAGLDVGYPNDPGLHMPPPGRGPGTDAYRAALAVLTDSERAWVADVVDNDGGRSGRCVIELVEEAFGPCSRAV